MGNVYSYDGIYIKLEYKFRENEGIARLYMYFRERRK